MNAKRIILWGAVLAAVTVTVGVANLAWGQGTAPPAPSSGSSEQTAEGWTVWMMIQASGVEGMLIILLSFVMVGLIIEHFTNIRDVKLIPPDFVQALQTAMEEKKYQDALQICEQSDNYISRIMQVGISEIRYGYDAMVDAMATIGEEESIKLQQKIGYIAMIATIAPLLGLLGTVHGMVVCFTQIAGQDVTNARVLAKGIYLALVTTVEGLVVAIPALFFYGFFQNRVTNISLEAGAVCEELIRRFKPVKVAGADIPLPRPAQPRPPASQPPPG